MSWFISSQSNISLLVSSKSWEETGRRNGGSSSASLQAFWLACVIWWLSSVTLCTCNISPMFLILQIWKGLWVQYILPANASCGGFGFVCSPQASSGLKKHFCRAQKSKAKPSKSVCQWSQSNGKQAYLLLQKHPQATGINMQHSCTWRGRLKSYKVFDS